MPRLRPRFNDWPTPRIELADTPDPACTVCAGKGGFEVPELDNESAYTEPCDCVDLGACYRILPVPRFVARLFFGYRAPGADPWADAPY